MRHDTMYQRPRFEALTWSRTAACAPVHFAHWKVIFVIMTDSVLKTILEGRERPTDRVSSTNPFQPHSHWRATGGWKKRLGGRGETKNMRFPPLPHTPPLVPQTLSIGTSKRICGIATFEIPHRPRKRVSFEGDGDGSGFSAKHVE